MEFCLARLEAHLLLGAGAIWAFAGFETFRLVGCQSVIIRLIGVTIGSPLHEDLYNTGRTYSSSWRGPDLSMFDVLGVADDVVSMLPAFVAASVG